MKLAFIELAKQGKVVNASLIPQEIEGLLEWAVDDEYDAYTNYIVLLDPADKSIQVESFKWIDESEDWVAQEIFTGDVAVSMAKSFGLIV